MPNPHKPRTTVGTKGISIHNKPNVCVQIKIIVCGQILANYSSMKWSLILLSYQLFKLDTTFQYQITI